MEKRVCDFDSRLTSLTAIHSLVFSCLRTSYPRCPMCWQISLAGFDLVCSSWSFRYWVSKKFHLYHRRRSRCIGYKLICGCAFGIKLTDVKTMRTQTNTSLYTIGSDSLVQQILTIYLCDQLTLYEPNYMEKEVNLSVLSSLARFVWVCMKYIPWRSRGL